MEAIIRSICAHGWSITFVPDGILTHADYTAKTVTVAVDTPIELDFLLTHELNHIIAFTEHTAQLSIVGEQQ